jgi:hypothetical protein
MYNHNFYRSAAAIFLKKLNAGEESYLSDELKVLSCGIAIARGLRVLPSISWQTIREPRIHQGKTSEI